MIAPQANETCSSRRSVLKGASALALATAALRMRSVLAADGTPVASPAAGEEPAGPPSWLFTQTFTSGYWEPTDDPALFALHLAGGLASTVGFTDRPYRDFMIMPTAELIPQLWDDPTNPPNAAIIVDHEGTQYTFLLVLNDPSYDAATDTVHYTVSVLDAYEGDGLGAAVERVADGTLPQSFGAGALFIDSLFGCGDNAKACRQVVTSGSCAYQGFELETAEGYLPESIQTTNTCSCLHQCNCSCDRSYWNNWCNTTYPDYCYALNDHGCVFMTYDRGWCVDCKTMPTAPGC